MSEKRTIEVRLPADHGLGEADLAALQAACEELAGVHTDCCGSPVTQIQAMEAAGWEVRRRLTWVAKAEREREYEEALGKTTAELGVMADQEQQDRAAEILAQYGRIRDLEMTVRTKGGELRTGLFSGELLEVQGQKYFLTMMVDITDRKRVEAERETSIQELRFALEQIKTLRGVVPICASCKKIRDDKGYWEQVDAFVARHTEAQFSHGICPDCVSRLYPDIKKESSK